MNSEITEAVVADDLTLTYASRRADTAGPAISGVSLRISAGEILAVIGDSGSGKSTLAAAFAGMTGIPGAGGARITGGSLTVLGQSMRHISTRRRQSLLLKVGYVPQDGGSRLLPHLTVAENVAQPIFSRDRRFSTDEAGEAVATAIDTVRLPLGVLGRYPHELSRGQRQRVAIATALILEPALLIADDPASGIDVSARGPILDIIREAQQRRPFSAMIVSHALSDVRRFSDRVAVMQRGVLVGLGPLDELLADPHHPYLRELASTAHSAAR
ncbi:MAG TPA: dipeptide/oligopeptide/nickel ABC transporter ATP-binding protein [Glaciihabitans sp.]|jgi:ABC-type glutathione transport system ATPase component|nr:dipeptide/oligopeptide/nickel ABC transporter ATP-binding protein [Glaciihabitans sp.]